MSQYDAARAVHRESPWDFDGWLDVGLHPAAQVQDCPNPGMSLPDIEVELLDAGNFLPDETANTAIVDAVRIELACEGSYKGATPTPEGSGGGGE